MKAKYVHILSLLRNSFKKEDTRFILVTGLKVTLISLIIHLILYGFIYEILRLNYVFFKSYGFQKVGDQSVFFDYILNSSIDNLTTIFLAHIFIFFIGTYVGWIILRPFRRMGDYCEKAIDHPNYPYKIDDFTTYKLLISFSELFFDHLRECRKTGVFSVKSIPSQYTGIHKPVRDKIFILHFGLLLVVILVCLNLFMIETTTGIYENLLELSSKYLAGESAHTFVGAQIFIVEDITLLIIIATSIGYISLGIHLYGKVSGAAFGIFSTMRSYLKGKQNSRVHLLGYEYVREHTRKINKYLDYLENQLK